MPQVIEDYDLCATAWLGNIYIAMNKMVGVRANIAHNKHVEHTK